jgi:leucyl aminopeptidase
MPDASQVAETFDVTPSVRRPVTVTTVPSPTDGGGLPDVDAVAVPVSSDGDLPADLGYDRPALARAGFTGAPGEALALPSAGGPARVVVGVGPLAGLDLTTLRLVAAAFARAVPRDARLAAQVPALPGVAAGDGAAAIVEGILLARYRFDLASRSRDVPVTEIVLLAPAGAEDDVRAGGARGLVLARAAQLGRDLANCPAGLLTATRIADVAVALGATTGLQVEVFDRDALVELGCGGLLGVNKGSVEPPRMVRLRYTPDGEPTGRLTLVGKGIMYDSGGISLKPSDVSHSQMKNDMTGAGCVLAAMSALRALGCRTAVTGYLMCTDNMPSGSAMQLGDVLTMRGGTTVEVLNTDAEGRLVMADALVLATEEPVDAVVDIATLTGACLRTFGTDIAGVMGNDQPLVDQLRAAGEAVDEPVWQLPLHRPYRAQLDSPIADLSNMGGPNAGSITAALFLAEFVGSVPWAHVDIAGTAQADAASGWTNKGATGFGTRLLIELALGFTPHGSAGSGDAVGVPQARHAVTGAPA